MNGKHDQYANKVLLPQFPCTQKNYTKLFIIISIMVMIIMATEIYFSLRHAGDGLSHTSHLVSSPRRSIWKHRVHWSEKEMETTSASRPALPHANGCAARTYHTDICKQQQLYLKFEVVNLKNMT